MANIYLDDIGSYPVSRSDIDNGGDDPNGLQDLAVVLGFNVLYSANINLIGVGTTNNREDAPTITRKIVSTAKQSVPVWPQEEIVTKIIFYARCPISATNKLAIAVGGECNTRNTWYYEGSPWLSWMDINGALYGSVFTFDEVQTPSCGGPIYSDAVSGFRGAYRFSNSDASTRTKLNTL